MAAKEQKADEDVLKLVEEQEREKEAAFQKILQLEKNLDGKQKLDLWQLIGTQVMKNMGGEEDMTLKIKMEEMCSELDDKIEEMDFLEDLNQALVIKEQKSNNELQEARKELIMHFREILSNRTTIGIKRMGEIDKKSFHVACKQKFTKDEADFNAEMLCSKWQDELRNPDWHPFRVIIVDGKEQESGTKKPVVAFIAGLTAPLGRRMGHAGGACTAEPSLTEIWIYRNLLEEPC